MKQETGTRLSGQSPPEPPKVDITLNANGAPRSPSVDARVTLHDALRDHLGLTGVKKGRDQGACGTCTVMVDGKRVVSCLALAARREDRHQPDHRQHRGRHQPGDVRGNRHRPGHRTHRQRDVRRLPHARQRRHP
ncbi:(2Fe-2S)-binding protein [Streptomyces yaanensis]|uniref:(2Fe-2S)-binding protein n=1 Tax=Streptomyces yaanensis TaxID=1142239 RepID=A0ABV7S8J5_9ACTN